MFKLSTKPQLILLSFLYLFTLPVECARSSSGETTGSGDDTGTSGSSKVTSLLPSSPHRSHHSRDLISAQFRAAKDGRDLDTSESSVAGIDSLSAAVAAASASELEDDLALSKYIASGSAYSPAKLRVNRYNQAGFYDPYPTYGAGTFHSGVPSSYYPYNGFGYRETNPMLDTYPYYERDRVKDLRERAMQASQSAPYSSSSNRDGFGGGHGPGPGGGNFLPPHSGYREGYRSNDHDNTAMSSGGGGGGGGGDEGGGWGWGHGHTQYTSKVNTNAIGLLGLLGLLSLLSNVLLQFTTTTTTTTTAAAGRRKRSAEPLEETGEEKRERIFMELLPLLTPIAHARDGVIPAECTFQGLCLANKVLVDELGVHGRLAGQKISNAVVKLLDKTSNLKHKKSNPLRKKLESAGLNGRNGKNCAKRFPTCAALKPSGNPQKGIGLPFIIRMKDLPQLISKVSSLTKNHPIPMNL